MTTIVVKLGDRVKRENGGRVTGDRELTPLQKDLQYKSLVLLTYEKNYFKMVNKQNEGVKKAGRKLGHQHFETLDDLRNQKV